MNQKIWIVEEKNDCPRGRAEPFLSSRDDQIETVESVEECLKVCENFAPNMAILHVNPQDPFDYALCDFLKKKFREVKVILITDQNSGEARMAPYPAMTHSRPIKPAGPEDPSARIGKAVPPKNDTVFTGAVSAHILEAGPVLLDGAAHRLYKNGVEIETTKQEFNLIRVMMEHAGEVLSRCELLDLAWGSGYFGHKTVDVHVHRLRLKIEDDPSRPYFIQTVCRVGYRFLKSDFNSMVT